MKIGISAIILILLSINVWGAITNYQVPTPIPIGKNLVISGQLDTNASGVLCSFLIYDANGGELIKRLSDEYTNSNGFFATDYYKVEEPNLFIDKNYNAKTNCGGSIATQTFAVAQSIPITDQTASYMLWLKNNVLAVIFVMAGIVILVGAFYLLVKGATG